MRKRTIVVAASFLVVMASGFVAWSLLPRAPGIYWTWRSSNPVRRGIEKARVLGCFQCHGELGTSGLPDPGVTGAEVPPWTGGTWMMYVKDEQDIREFILDGHLQRKKLQESDAPAATAIRMPAYRRVVRSTDVDDLVAAYKVLAGMVRPPADSAAFKGQELARRWSCFSCHGPAGAGGYPNPASFTGFIPGWHGPDFEDLVRGRGEFDAWLKTGAIPRLTRHPIAPFFLKRQRIRMPAYANLTSEERDALWEYVQWLNSPSSR